MLPLAKSNAIDTAPLSSTTFPEPLMPMLAPSFTMRLSVFVVVVLVVLVFCELLSRDMPVPLPILLMPCPASCAAPPPRSDSPRASIS
ncbi:hypothetical protein D9M69_669630 [compost metagenome]